MGSELSGKDLIIRLTFLLGCRFDEMISSKLLWWNFWRNHSFFIESIGLSNAESVPNRFAMSRSVSLPHSLSFAFLSMTLVRQIQRLLANENRRTNQVWGFPVICFRQNFLINSPLKLWVVETNARSEHRLNFKTLLVLGEAFGWLENSRTMLGMVERFSLETFHRQEGERG